MNYDPLMIKKHPSTGLMRQCMKCNIFQLIYTGSKEYPAQQRIICLFLPLLLRIGSFWPNLTTIAASRYTAVVVCKMSVGVALVQAMPHYQTMYSRSLFFI